MLTKFSFYDKLISARLSSTSNKYFYDYAIERNVEEVRRFSFAKFLEVCYNRTCRGNYREGVAIGLDVGLLG